jgi:hypothetical protein
VDFESIIKVASFVLGLVGAAKVIYEISTGRRSGNPPIFNGFRK